MKQNEFLGTDFPDTDPCYSAPMEEFEVKYLLLRNATAAFIQAIQQEQAKQIADVLLPVARIRHAYNQSTDGGLKLPDFETAEGVESFFDKTFFRDISNNIRKQMSRDLYSN